MRAPVAASAAVLFMWAQVEALPVTLDNMDAFVNTTIAHEDYRETTCGDRCDEFCKEDDCPLNVVGFQTRYEGFYGENATEEGHEEHNHIISNVGVPSVVIGYCGFEAHCALSITDIEHRGNFWVHAMQNLENMREAVPGEPFERNMDLLSFSRQTDGAFKDGGLDTFALGFQVQEVIEFRDVNGDTRFTPNVDEVIQRIDLGTIPWKYAFYKAEHAIGTRKPRVTVQSYNMSSADGTISMRFETANYPDAPPPSPMFSELADGQIRHPNATRVITRLNNITWKGGDDSRVAIKAFLVTPNQDVAFADLVGRQVLIVDKITGKKLGYFAYTPMAMVRSGTGPSAGEWAAERVKASPLRDVMDTREVGYSLARSTRGESDSSEVRVIYFSFAGNTFKPQDVLWDVSLGVGEIAQRSRQAFWAGAVTLTIVVSGFALIVANREVLLQSFVRGVATDAPKSAPAPAEEPLDGDETA